MSNLSSETLFHFTPSLDNLMNILSGGIKFGLFAEKFPKGKEAYFVRGISFCNIPLSMISEHVQWYGHYALGLKRSKLRELGASPVFYVHSDTKNFPGGKNAKQKLLSNPFLCYIKQHYGYQFNKQEGKYRLKKFYDEKEWRLFKGEHEIQKYTNLEDLEIIRKQKDSSVPVVDNLNVDLDMIEYIVLEKPKDFVVFDSFLKNRYSKDRDLYLPKILYYTQIRKDF